MARSAGDLALVRILRPEKSRAHARTAMFTFLVPLCLTPVILGLAYAQRQARKLGYLDGVVAPWRNGHAKKASREVFWQVDVPGLLLMVAAYVRLTHELGEAAHTLAVAHPYPAYYRAYRGSRLAICFCARCAMLLLLHPASHAHRRHDRSGRSMHSTLSPKAR